MVWLATPDLCKQITVLMSRHAESTLQAHCVAWFRLQYPAKRRLLFAIPNGAFLQGDARRRAMRWAMLQKEGANPGTADMFLAIPSGDLAGLFIEMKTPSGRQSTDQAEFEQAVLAEGYGYVMPRTLEEFQRVIKSYLETGKY